jgi:hypothetical protein
MIPQFCYAQAAVSASGSQLKSTGGAMNFTVGQVVFTSKPGSSGRMSEGVQQVYPAKVTPVNELVHLREVTLFPNPTDELLTLKIPDLGTEKATYIVLDGSGKMLNTDLVQSPLSEISLSGLPAGTYHILLKTGLESRAFKVIKR